MAIQSPLITDTRTHTAHANSGSTKTVQDFHEKVTTTYDARQLEVIE